MSVKLLVRFDDMCPTLNWPVWRKLEEVMIDEGIKPILSVVPDNQDPQLCEGEPDEHFWDYVRSWQARGWTIGLHGYQHRYVTKESGIIGLNNYSEFAGLPLEEQYGKLQKGLEIFAREGVRADVWVAPAHSFDANTIKALVSFGIRAISDGMSLYPHRDSQGVLWVPQQLWRFRMAPFGVWTVCIHSKDRLYVDSQHFRRCVRQYRAVISSLPEVMQAYASRKHGWTDDAFAGLWGFAIRAKVALADRGAKEPSLAVTIEPEPSSRPGLNAAP
jgi:predicted deacetylase